MNASKQQRKYRISVNKLKNVQKSWKKSGKNLKKANTLKNEKKVF